MKRIISLLATAAIVTIALAVGINHSKSNTPKPINQPPKADTDVDNTSKTAALVPLIIDYPPPTFIGTLIPPKGIPNMEPPTKPGYKRPPIMVPEGTTNVALGKLISASEEDPFVGTIDMVNDSISEGVDGCYIEFGPGQQSVTIDLGEQHNIYAIVLWHYHMKALVYFDVIVQTADDQDFINNVEILFNNDHDNTSGMGIGKDKNYIETNLGKLINAKGTQGRYVRLYSNGNNVSDLNHITEVEVYGQPVKNDIKRQLSPEQPDSQGNNPLKEDKLVPLKIEYPQPRFCSTPRNFNNIPNLEPMINYRKYFNRPPLMVPEGTTNIALDKQFSYTDDNPIIGHIDMITDGDKEAGDDSCVELGLGQQHVTIDLGNQYNIYAIAVWHSHGIPRVYYDVIIQSASDQDFVNNNILFNNDIDNTTGLGCGKDKNYIETNYGKLIDAKGVQGRYVRLYSNGNDQNELNHYTEIEVYGKAVTHQQNL